MRNIYSMRNIFSLFLLLIMGLSSMVIAQTGQVAGAVMDNNGQPVVGVNVFLQNTTLGAATDENGEFVILNVPQGEYTIVVSYVGYKSQTANLSVSEGETSQQNFTISEDPLLMDAVVVTGTPGGIGIRKKDASFAINTVNAEEIERISPSSTASLLDVVPGVWSESSGGVAGANIFVRGLPSSGDAPFVTMAINGGPVYGTETLSFFEQSTIFRIDETVELTEASRGGPSAVFSNAEPGMTVNFNLKKGGEKTESRLKYTTSDYNLQRLDGYLSGKVSDGLYYMVGGYVRTSPGIRNTQFNAENGVQLTGQLTKVFDSGAINVFTRLTNDYGQWVLPMALETGNAKGTFSPLGNSTRFRTLQINSQGDSASFDFGRGRGWKGNISGLNANIDLGSGWMLSDVLSYTSGDANTFGFVPEGSPIRVSALGGGTVTTVGGETLASTDYIQSYGHWVVMKELEAISNDISLNKKWQEHDITLGLYQAHWSSNDFWTLGNQVGVQNVENGDILANVTADDIAAAGGGGTWYYGLNYAGDAKVNAGYIADSWQIMPALRIDLGARYQFFYIDFALDAGDHPDGVTDKSKSLSGEDFAYTGAVNYDINEQFGVFARYSDSYLFPHFDMIREDLYSLDGDGNIESNDFVQYELGAKYDAGFYSFFATAFMNSVDVFDGDVGSSRASAILQTETMGLELDGAFRYESFFLRGIATYQSGEIKKSDQDPAVEGNSIWRQPDWQLRLSPSYSRPIAGLDATVYGAFRMVGERWDSRGNVFKLDGYTKIDGGLTVSTKGGITFGLHVDNVTDEDALTEGDPRDPASANGRPIFGRSIKFSTSVDF